jgi:hypothetical protein
MFNCQQQPGNTKSISSNPAAGSITSGTSHLKVPGKGISVPPLPSTSPQSTKLAVPDLPVGTTAVVVRMPTAARPSVVLDREPTILPYNLHHRIGVIRDQYGKAYAVIDDGGNAYVLAVGSKKLNAIISGIARHDGTTLSKRALGDLNEVLAAYAEQYGVVREVWLRVAPVDGGIEIDMGDDAHTRINIAPGRVTIVAAGSNVLFYRTANSKAMVMPAQDGNLKLLTKYLNVNPTDALLLTAWISYTIAHPKLPTAKYPILALQGNQGSGKTSLCENIIIRIIDPSAIGVQVFPSSAKDLAIAGQNAHVLCFDNLRSFKDDMADMLCIAATGGTITTRQLYTDADQQAIRLHVPLVLNGIHAFVDQPDLAQRCLTMHLKPIAESKRKSETELAKELDADLPAIMRGIFDLIAGIFTHLPNIKVTDPARMIDFVKWLAAMEMVEGAPAGTYQSLYSETLQQGQLDALMDNPLSATIMMMVDDHKGDSWSGTPVDLLSKLNKLVDQSTQRSREWPQNPIALSKRISALQAGLLSQGIKVELTRGKQRTVTISKRGI